MKKILIIIDGMYDLDLKHYFTKSFLNNFKQSFVNYTYDNRADSFECFLRILGIKERVIGRLNRAYFETNNDQFESYGRFNIVRLKNDYLEDFTSGLSSQLIKQLIKQIANNAIINIDDYHGVMAFESNIIYKGYLPSTYPSIAYQDLYQDLPIEIKNVVSKCNTYLKDIDSNIVLWPYSFKPKEQINDISLSGYALVAHKIALLKVASHLNISTFTDSSMNGLETTNLVLKKEQAISSLKSNNTCLIHIDGVDNLAHKGKLNDKIIFLNKIEREILQPLLEYCTLKNYKLEIICDHICDCRTRRHHTLDVIKLERRI